MGVKVLHCKLNNYLLGLLAWPWALLATSGCHTPTIQITLSSVVFYLEVY